MKDSGTRGRTRDSDIELELSSGLQIAIWLQQGDAGKVGSRKYGELICAFSKILGPILNEA